MAELKKDDKVNHLSKYMKWIKKDRLFKNLFVITPFFSFAILLLPLIGIFIFDFFTMKLDILGNFSRDNRGSISDILTVDSIVTGSMFTFIVVSIDRGSDRITRMKNKLYWSDCKLYLDKKSGNKFSRLFINRFTGIFYFMQIPPIWSVILSILCTIGEGMSMYIGTTIFSIACLSVTTILMISSVFRVNYFSNHWIEVFALCFARKKFAKNNSLKVEMDLFKDYLKMTIVENKLKKDKGDKEEEFDFIYGLLQTNFEKVAGNLFDFPSSGKNENTEVNNSSVNSESSDDSQKSKNDNEGNDGDQSTMRVGI